VSRAVGFVLDSGALIALERDKGRASRLLIAVLERAPQLTISAGALAEVWRDGSRQTRLARLLKARSVDVVPLDREFARAVGELIGASGHPDVVDVHVALCARQRDQPIVTSDAEDLRRVDPRLLIVEL
jgi:predicted nucleic acid-binding protein